jgi:hypothetical protein
MYYKGEGVLEDYVEAYKWALLAAMDKADAADVLLKEILRKKMTPSQIEDAQREAKEFLAQQEQRSKGDKQAPETIRATLRAR